MVAWKRCFMLGFAPVLMNCSLWLDVEAPQCTSNLICVQKFGFDYTCSNAGVCLRPKEMGDAGSEPSKPDLPPQWECLNEDPSSFVLDPDRVVTIRMDAVEFSTLRTPADLKAMVCNPADLECNSPILSDVTPGTDGFLEFDVPQGFAGFLHFEAPNILPALTYNNRPWIDNMTTSGPALVTHKLLQDIYDRAGRPTNDDRGLAVLEIRDCRNAAAAGVSFDDVAGEVPFYFDGALPTRDISATTISTLLAARGEERAVGGFSNLPSGITTFTVRIAGTETLVAEYTMAIRPGHVSYVRLYPQWR